MPWSEGEDSLRPRLPLENIIQQRPDALLARGGIFGVNLNRQPHFTLALLTRPLDRLAVVQRDLARLAPRPMPGPGLAGAHDDGIAGLGAGRQLIARQVEPLPVVEDERRQVVLEPIDDTSQFPEFLEFLSHNTISQEIYLSVATSMVDPSVVIVIVPFWSVR